MTHHDHDDATATGPADAEVPPEHAAQVEEPPEPDTDPAAAPGDPDEVPPEHAAQAAEAPADGADVDDGGASEEDVPEDPLAAAHRERDEYLDALRRKQAEFENFRKRMMRDGASQRIAGHAEIAERMLDVLDDFDRTLDAAGDDVDPGFLKGVQLVHDKLARVLADFGLTRIDEADVTFDPNRHEAVQQVAAEEARDEPLVSQVLRPGYELGGRTLRAAMVVVAQ